MRGRTWLVLAESAGASRTEKTDHLARSVEAGLSYTTGEPLPEYLGVWLAPNGGHYHMYTDHSPETHERFGWLKPSGATDP